MESLTDDQKIAIYLNPKMMRLQFPYTMMHTEGIDKLSHPREYSFIRQASDSCRYFCTRREVSLGLDAIDIVPGSRGFWRPANEDGSEDIFYKGKKIGEKRELIYWEAHRTKSKWVMYEYKPFFNDDGGSPSSPVTEYLKGRLVYKLKYMKDDTESEPDEEESAEKLAHERAPDDVDVETADAEAAAIAEAFVLDIEKKDEPPAVKYMKDDTQPEPDEEESVEKLAHERAPDDVDVDVDVETAEATAIAEAFVLDIEKKDEPPAVKYMKDDTQSEPDEEESVEKLAHERAPDDVDVDVDVETAEATTIAEAFVLDIEKKDEPPAVKYMKDDTQPEPDEEELVEKLAHERAPDDVDVDVETAEATAIAEAFVLDIEKKDEPPAVKYTKDDTQSEPDEEESAEKLAHERAPDDVDVETAEVDAEAAAIAEAFVLDVEKNDEPSVASKVHPETTGTVVGDDPERDDEN